MIPVMIIVKRRDEKESAGSLMRRFNRSVQQSGVLALSKGRQFFRKPISKRERRLAAIQRQKRRHVNRATGTRPSPPRRGR